HEEAAVDLEHLCLVLPLLVGALRGPGTGDGEGGVVHALLALTGGDLALARDGRGGAQLLQGPLELRRGVGRGGLGRTGLVPAARGQIAQVEGAAGRAERDRSRHRGVGERSVRPSSAGLNRRHLASRPVTGAPAARLSFRGRAEMSGSLQSVMGRAGAVAGSGRESEGRSRRYRPRLSARGAPSGPSVRARVPNPALTPGKRRLTNHPDF